MYDSPFYRPHIKGDNVDVSRPGEAVDETMSHLAVCSCHQDGGFSDVTTHGNRFWRAMDGEFCLREAYGRYGFPRKNQTWIILPWSGIDHLAGRGGHTEKCDAAGRLSGGLFRQSADREMPSETGCVFKASLCGLREAAHSAGSGRHPGARKAGCPPAS